MARVNRTVAVRSIQLPGKVLRVFVVLEGMHYDIVEQLAIYAVKTTSRASLS